jgi:hypothetical protein
MTLVCEPTKPFFDTNYPLSDDIFGLFKKQRRGGARYVHPIKKEPIIGEDFSNFWDEIDYDIDFADYVNKIKNGSWKECELIGIDSEAKNNADGILMPYIWGYEKKKKVYENRKFVGYIYEPKYFTTDCFYDFIKGILKIGNGFKRVRNKKVSYVWTTEQLQFLNIKYDGSNALKLLPHQYVDKILEYGESLIPFNANNKIIAKPYEDYIIEQLVKGTCAQDTRISQKLKVYDSSDFDSMDEYVSLLLPLILNEKVKLVNEDIIIGSKKVGSYQVDRVKYDIMEDIYEPIKNNYIWFVKIRYLDGKWRNMKFIKKTQPKNFRVLVKDQSTGEYDYEYVSKNCKIQEINCWDISPFYNYMGLNKAAKKYLGESKTEYMFDGSILDVSKLNDEIMIAGEYHNYADYYSADIIAYVKRDASLTGKLARFKLNEYVNAGVRFRQSYSPASLAQQHALDLGYDDDINLLGLPVINGVNKKYAMLQASGSVSFYGGIFDFKGIGTFLDIVDPDEVSCYPAFIRLLKQLTHYVYDEETERMVQKVKGVIIKGDYKNVDTWNKWIENRDIMDYGFCSVKVEFKQGTWYGMQNRAKDGGLCTPRIADGWITAPEYAELLKWDGIKIEVMDWIYHYDKDPVYPLQEVVDRFFRMKDNAPKGSSDRAVAKVGANSIFGKLAQESGGRMGKMWDKAKSSMITGMGRARMLELNRLNDFSAISMATDGIIFHKKDLKVLPHWEHSPKEFPNLGQWELDHKDGVFDCIILGSGIYSIVERVEHGVKVDQKYKTVFRGSARLFIQGQYKTWFEFCEAHKNDSIVSKTIQRPRSIKIARMRDKEIVNGIKVTNYDNTNVFMDETFDLRPYTTSWKRKMISTPKTFGDLLNNTYDAIPYETLEEMEKAKRQAGLVVKYKLDEVEKI